MKHEPTRWKAASTPGLYVRQPCGGFYARITLNGKRSWRFLKTDKLREAQKLLRDLQSGHTFIYRLLKHARLKRVLFLVDTRNLGDQADPQTLHRLQVRDELRGSHSPGKAAATEPESSVR